MKPRLPVAIARLVNVAKAADERCRNAFKLRGLFNAALLSLEMEFSVEGLSQVVWAAARLKHRDEDFYVHLYKLTTANTFTFTSRSAALYLEALALDKSAWSQSAVEAVMEQVSSLTIDESNPRDVCQILRACVKLERGCQAPSWAIEAALLTIRNDSWATGGSHNYEACVEELCWSLARIRSTRAQMLKAVHEAVDSERLILSSMAPVQLASLLLSMGMASDAGRITISANRALMARLVSYCEAGSWVGVTAPALSSVVWACARVGVEQLTDITIDASHPFMSMDFSSLNEKSMARLIHGALQLYNGKLPIWLNIEKLAPHLRRLVPLMNAREVSDIIRALPPTAANENNGVSRLMTAIWGRTLALVQEVADDTPRRSKVDVMALVVRCYGLIPSAEVAAAAESVAGLESQQTLLPEQRLLNALGKTGATYVLPQALVQATLKSLEVSDSRLLIDIDPHHLRYIASHGLIASLGLATPKTDGFSSGRGSARPTDLSPTHVLEILVEECNRREWRDFTPGQLSRIFWACAKCEIHSIILKSTSSVNPLLWVSLDDFSGAEMANFVWAIHKLAGNTWPSWCNIQAISSSSAPSTMSLHDLGVLAFALAKVEGTFADSVFDSIWQRLNIIIAGSPRPDGKETANLVSIMWSFAWRGCSDGVQQMSVSVMDELPHLSAETQSLALWAMAKAKLRLPAYVSRSVQQSLLSRPITRHTANALVNLWVLRPSQRVIFPNPLSDFPPEGLWKLVGITAASRSLRREALSLALKCRGVVVPSAAAHYAGCLTVDEGFLQCSPLRINILRPLVHVNRTPPKYLTKLACHLCDLA
ncbi:hypothetical protein Pmar_PMAR025863 [Perkinsus marinus ATCC 50983]|uniref:RAP domain-containing protein n=1 Tax=Perkinsus marinus (strain ATCC 50983 / TXsc) TaxID=423536 RepID=C5LUX5_PERM5|nr:hypothetical protein Pmar_PMAR025863 [Perkinsus marinus ATCC 50983]EEQ99475.1 hypothetical protein Pmar_PMAR025863 [Perkinsus marinus ATCC 50983]|eukprot:XP_002766758.1 hypothetical protein Pmar_PMAR025863 [Perkinsus marinus ATCC 50983]